MAIQLQPKKASPFGVNLHTINNNRLNRINRTRQDLNKSYSEEETKSTAQILNLPYINLYGFPIDTAHLIVVTKEDATATKTGVFVIKSGEAYLATPDYGASGQDELIQKLEQNGYHPKLHLCSTYSFEKLLKTYDFIIQKEAVDDSINVSQANLDKSEQDKINLQNLNETIRDLPMSDIVETILSAALQSKASDIHFEPEKLTYNLRLRIDGVLHTFAELSKEVQRPLEQRLKLISGLKLNVDNVPQDGRFSFKAPEKDIDVRVSMLPSSYGYSVVMRLLGTGNVELRLADLGFSDLASEQVRHALSKPQGMILTTGPTGSGKTTTLYTFLSDLNDGESKIITLEDPIEYKLSGVSQTQIDVKAGYTFGGGLRSILRQDPDIVMVGEIRDKETADTAVQASLTGHQVLSTVHTNDAAGALPRLMEMEIKGFLLADSLSVIIGQRLVRKICQFCKIPHAISDEQRSMVVDQLSKLPEVAKDLLPNHMDFYTSPGCDKCSGLGYKGRVGVYEVLTMTDGLRELISTREPSIVEVRDTASREGMVTMFQDGLIKALNGLTDLTELQRVVTE